MSVIVKVLYVQFGGLSYQSKGPENRHCIEICQPQFHQTQDDNNTVEYVPALLEIIVWVHSYNLQNHFTSEDRCKYLFIEI